MKKLIILFLLLVMAPLSAHAQLWTGIVDSDRAIDWSDVGATITDRTTSCTTAACNRIWCGINTAGATICDAYPNGLDSTSITGANINTAISGAPDNTVVRLPACSRNITPGLVFSRSNVTLRGLGANQTILNFTGTTDCLGGAYNALMCVGGSYASPYGPEYQTNWTANFTKGTSTITVASATNIAVGNMVILSQNGDTTDSSFVHVCADPTYCGPTNNNGSGWAYNGKTYYQISKVTAKSGNDITIDPPVLMPTWSASKSPIVWGTTTTKTTGIGIEDLKIINGVGASSYNNILMSWSDNCWVKGIVSTLAGKGHVTSFQTLDVTIRDSYFYASQAYDSEQYGLHLQGATRWLVENNIFQKMPSGAVPNGGNMSLVLGYNYMLQMDFSGGDWWGGVVDHDASGDFILAEGNDNPAARTDDINGTHNLLTFFRNFWSGNDPTKSYTPKTGYPIQLDSYSRLYNIIGNVLGTNSVHTTYASIYSIASDSSAGLMRWGNYDTGTDAVRWESSEVPSGIAQYANAVPANHTLPNSFYLSSKPSFFGSITWPPIGPDVTGGDVTGWDGHVNKIPARVCYDNTIKDVNGMLTDFNADVCYAESGGSTGPSTAKGLTIKGGTFK